MNTYITLACLLAVCGVVQSNAIGGIGYGLGGLGGLGGVGYGLGGLGGLGGVGYGLGGLGYGIHAPVVLAPAAVSTQNLIKAAPIPVIKTIAAPVIVKSVVSPWGLGGYGSYGLSSSGLGVWGGKGVLGDGIWGNGLSYGGWGKH